MYRYFHIEEFACPCCGKNKVKPELIERLDQARFYASVPFVVTSGYRCPKHNREIGGVPDSAHLKGLAADIAAASSRQRYLVLMGLLRAGFRRIGIGHNFIHADIDLSKPYPVIWLY